MWRPSSAAVASAWAAHVLAWTAGGWLAFGPAYQGVSAGEGTRYTATLIEVNGLYVVLLLLVPVLLSGIAVWVVRGADGGRTGRRVLLWVLAIVLLGLCALSILSIGVFYLPAALAMLVAAIAGSAVGAARRRQQRRA